MSAARHLNQHRYYCTANPIVKEAARCANHSEKRIPHSHFCSNSNSFFTVFRYAPSSENVFVGLLSCTVFRIRGFALPFTRTKSTLRTPHTHTHTNPDRCCCDQVSPTFRQPIQPARECTLCARGGQPISSTQVGCVARLRWDGTNRCMQMYSTAGAVAGLASRVGPYTVHVAHSPSALVFVQMFQSNTWCGTRPAHWGVSLLRSQSIRSKR